MAIKGLFSDASNVVNSDFIEILITPAFGTVYEELLQNIN